MAFRSSDALVILLRKLPEGCKTRPSKLRCNSSLRPIVSKFDMWVHVHYMYLNSKIWSAMSEIPMRYLKYGVVPLPNLTANLYIFFQIFCRVFQSVSNVHSRMPWVYTPITCVTPATEPWGSGVLDLSTREQELSSRSATRTYLNFTTSVVYYHQNNTCTMCI